MILDAVENHVPVIRLLFTIAGFAIASMAVSAALTYARQNSSPGRISVRCEIVNLLNRKAATTAYPNLEDNRFLKLLEKSNEYTNCNQEAAGAIWETLTLLLINLTCFFLYGSLLTQVQPVLILVILATSGTSYFLSRHLDSYRYTHLDEEAEYAKRMLYLLNQAKDFGAAKDIRIFGLRTWLEELYEKIWKLFLPSTGRRKGYTSGHGLQMLFSPFAKWNRLCIPDLSGISAGDGCAGIPFIVHRSRWIFQLGSWNSGWISHLA